MKLIEVQHYDHNDYEPISEEEKADGYLPLPKYKTKTYLDQDKANKLIYDLVSRPSHPNGNNYNTVTVRTREVDV